MTCIDDRDNEDPMVSESKISGSESTLRPAGVEEARSDDGSTRLVMTGNWTTRGVAGVDKQMRELEEAGAGDLVIDLEKVEHFDTAGAFVVQRTVEHLRAAGKTVRIEGATQNQQVLFKTVSDAAKQDVPRKPKARITIATPFAALGRTIIAAGGQVKDAFGILGAAIAGSQFKLSSGHGISLTAITAQIDKIGVGAIPVVLLMNAIIGAIVAQQGAFQLRYFGAEIFVVDLVSVLVLRETGALITAIMIAGRSGSAITAEIGSMKMREEIDALKVIGLNPIGVLVFPRLVALMIALPLLTVAADAAGLMGAMVIANYYSDISFTAFLDRMQSWIDLSTVMAGLLKAPFMALVIGVIASMEGLRVGGSAESLGQRVTASVVKSIFCVIVLDGFFAIFYASIGF